MENSVVRARKDRKKRLQIGILCAALLIALCLLGFAPFFNNRLSGEPRPVYALTRTLADSTARQLGAEHPVLLIHDEENPCYLPPRIDHPPEMEWVYYVWMYSEKRRTSCLTAYGLPVEPLDGWKGPQTVLPTRGAERLGLRLSDSGVLKVIPLQRFLRVHTPELLALLDWRITLAFWPERGDAGRQKLLSPGREG